MPRKILKNQNLPERLLKARLTESSGGREIRALPATVAFRPHLRALATVHRFHGNHQCLSLFGGLRRWITGQLTSGCRRKAGGWNKGEGSKTFRCDACKRDFLEEMVSGERYA